MHSEELHCAREYIGLGPARVLQVWWAVQLGTAWGGGASAVWKSHDPSARFPPSATLLRQRGLLGSRSPASSLPRAAAPVPSPPARYSLPPVTHQR